MALVDLNWVTDDEVEDLPALFSALGAPIVIETPEYIADMPSDRWLFHDFFCNTVTAQKHLANLGLSDCVPDTYDARFQAHFHRTIQCVGTVDRFPAFVKPVGNRKEFDGFIARNAVDLKAVWDAYEYEPTADAKFYVSPVIAIVHEHRLLIGKGELYACGAKLGEEWNASIRTGQPTPSPPAEFQQALVECTGADYLCVDVGFDSVRQVWLVVEINPPFSLDNDTIPYGPFVRFCKHACGHLRSRWLERTCEQGKAQ